jgi:hypothetical protein
MKKIYTIIIAAFACTQTANAQFTMLQPFHEPSTLQDNNVTGGTRYDSVGVVPKSTGTSQTWDFGPFLMSTVAVTSTYVPVSSAPHASLFTTSNIAQNMGGGNYNYFKSDTTAKNFELVGTMAGTMAITYNDPKKIHQWPVSFNSTFNDAYSASSSLGTTVGNHSMTCTGWGTLILPNLKTVSNVMQLTSWDSQTLTVLTQTSTVHMMSHYYYASTNRYPLLWVNYTHMATDSTATIWVNWLEATGLTDNNLEADYSIYPNPASGQFGVKLSNSTGRPCILNIQSINGQVIRTENLGTSDVNTTINVSDLAKGVYIVRTAVGDRTSTRKLIVE